MKKLTKVSVTVVTISSALILAGPLTSFAVTPPDLTLGITATYSVYGHSGITNTGGISSPTRVWGNVSGNGAGIGSFTSTQVPSGTIDNTSGTGDAIELDAGSVYDSLMSGTQGSASILNISGTHTGASAIHPGVYTIADNPLNGAVELSGAGVYIFQSASLNATPHSGTVTLTNGATACNVWWAVAGGMQMGSAQMIGTIISKSGTISMTSGATLVGRAIVLVGQVTLDNTQITQPTCATATVAASVGSAQNGTITVVKTVINDSGGTKKVADFPLFVNSTATGHQQVVSGETNIFFTFGLYPYTVTETSDPNYTATFSGDCDANGFLNLRPGDQKVCLITNNDKGTPLPVVPPLIDVLKTASPLSLPAGPGSVVYTYTLRNIGTVPVTDVTMVGDTCSPIVRNSGDTNGDNKLDLNETWVYTCTQRLTATHTNTVTATGWANGISAVDLASATVVVGLPIVPPLIHVVKVPSVFTLSAPGGAVTYTYTVTNPGTAPLSNVSITDNKCTGLPGRVVGHPGDLNKNNLLDPGEIWQFTCKSNLTQTTTNIGTAAGSANGLTARDFAIATVVVASPTLPNTGMPPQSRTPWDIFISAGILMLVSTSLVRALKKRTV